MMSHWMFNCREVSKMVSKSMDAELMFHERALIRIHLMMCRYCARFRRHLALLRRFSRDPILEKSSVDPSISLPEESRRRIQENLLKIL